MINNLNRSNVAYVFEVADKPEAEWLTDQAQVYMMILNASPPPHPHAVAQLVLQLAQGPQEEEPQEARAAEPMIFRREQNLPQFGSAEHQLMIQAMYREDLARLAANAEGDIQVEEDEFLDQGLALLNDLQDDNLDLDREDQLM